MLPIFVPGGELWDERNEEMIYTKPTQLRLEHSLISISKWESKWHVSFFDTKKNEEQTMSYIRCMSLNPDVDPNVFYRLTRKDLSAINEYIEDPMTASTIREVEGGRRHGNERITSELIYYWMIQFGIPVEFEKWHINRLIMLIRICSEKNKPAKKMSQSDIAARYRAINNANRAKFHTKG